MPKQTRRRRKRVRGGLFGLASKISQKTINKNLSKFYAENKDSKTQDMVMSPYINTDADADDKYDLPPPPDEKYTVGDGTRPDFIKWLNKLNGEFDWSTFPDKTLQEIADEIDKHDNKSKYLSDFAVKLTKERVAINKGEFNKKGGKNRSKRRRRYTKK